MSSDGYLPVCKKSNVLSGGGAISWEQMQATLNSIGFETSLHHKPSTYKQFLKQVQEGRASLVLVSSANRLFLLEKYTGTLCDPFLIR